MYHITVKQIVQSITNKLWLIIHCWDHSKYSDFTKVLAHLLMVSMSSLGEANYYWSSLKDEI